MTSKRKYPEVDSIRRFSIVDTNVGTLVSREDDEAGWEPKWTKKISEARSFKTRREAKAYVLSSIANRKHVEVLMFEVTMYVAGGQFRP